ncbi:ribbon-helix-helix protein, CopG family [Microbacterium sp.]|uniref:ribbon-helix-helix protein, CopG family n=1 Tax=Microbacterium sp. TaxID=51671 RepID=UPI003A8D7444
MKTAISIPDGVAARVEQRAAELGVSRSAFFTAAARRYLEELDADDVTLRIDMAIERTGVQAEFDRSDWAASARDALAELDDDEW